MRANLGQRYTITLALVGAVACATATEDDIPTPESPEAVGNTGGTSVNATGGAGPDSGTGGTTATGGSGSATGGTGFGSGGSTGSGGSKSGGAANGGGSGSPSPAACPDPRAPATSGAAQGDSGSFGTLEAVCYFVEGTFNSWNCSNLGGRTISVNGTPMPLCGGPLPEKVDGGYYFEFGASASIEYTSFYWYTS
jgi:hypothetical protein